MENFKSFLKEVIKIAISGNKRYNIWMAFLTFIMLIGVYAYSIQIEKGLSATGMHDSVSWGLYISNFTFLVGIAAAAVMLVLPTYIFNDKDFHKVVILGEAVAVSALIMCLMFVIADLGGPERAWHMIPIVGLFNWPNSMLTWDVLVLWGYLFINISIPMYLLYMKFTNREPNKNIYYPGVFISIAWAVGIHMITAFLYAGLPAKPFWNSSLLGPKFLASAFTAGPALIVLILSIINKFTELKINDNIFRKLSIIITVAAQINLVMLVSELFKEFYFPTHHSISAQYLYFGLKGYTSLVPWIWTSVILIIIATITLTYNWFPKSNKLLYFSCIALFIGIWIEKGMGLIVPGFIPGSYGKIVEYFPSFPEVFVTLGIWAMGAFVFSILSRVSIKILKDNSETNRYS